MIAIRGKIAYPVRRDFLLKEQVSPPIETIIQEVCEKHGLTVSQLLSDRRSRYISRPRWEAFYRAANETQMSLPAIGRAFGKHHTTVMHGIRRYQERMGL